MKKIVAIASFAALAGVSFLTTLQIMDNDRAATEQPTRQVAVVNAGPLAEPLRREQTDEVAIAAGSSDPSGIAQLPDNFLPFGANIGGDFDLIDHFGEPRQMEDYRGKHVLIFFGYANCQAICSAALPLMADAINLVGNEHKAELVPLMITVDPENDTPDFMREKLGEYHPSLIGMTGSDGALADVRNKFHIRTEHVGIDIEGNPIINHGSFVYLMGPDGKFQTLIPPVVAPEQMASIIRKYMTETNT